jgi:tetratricopeptide (TPR) repeat protein
MKTLTLLFIAALGITMAFNGYAQDADTTPPTTLSPEQTQAARMDALSVLIKRQQYPQAYELATRMLTDNEGLPKFDFQYGMAAVESGHYDQALFAFERLVLSFPNQPRYRLELARTHFYLRNLVRAEVEFNNVLKQNPPEPVKKNVMIFIDRIADLKRSVESKFMFVLDVGGGYDSNINSATSEKILPSTELNEVLATFGDIELNDASRETGSAYWSALAHMAYISPLTKTSAFDLRLVTSTRSNSETPIYDLTTAMGELGYSFYTGPVKWRGAGRYQYIQLDGEELLNSQSALGQANWMLSKGSSIGFGINYGMSSYPEDADGDITQQQFNLSYASAPKKDNWKLTLIFGTDSADKSSNEHSGKTYQGFTYQSSSFTSQRSNRYWLFSVLSSEYDAINSALYSKLRKDQNATLGIGWRYNFSSHFSFRNDYSFTYNDSSLEANTYQRAKAEVGLTYSF